MNIGTDLSGKKFAVAYSGGKDSTFAMYKALKAGMIPVCMIIMTDESNDRSWAHGIPPAVLAQVGPAFGLPLVIMKSNNSNYDKVLEEGIAKAGEMGAEYCVFGDLFEVPIEKNWNTERCRNAGIEPLYPLMGRERRELIEEFTAAGFKTVINSVNTDVLSEDFLGRTIDSDVISDLLKTDSDICGENGEYHSFVFDGPILAKPIEINWGDKIRFTNSMGNYTFKAMM